MIRIAKVTDSFDIATIIVEGWKSAYTGMIDEEYLKKMTVENRTRRVMRSILNQKEKSRYYIYQEEHETLGVIKFGLAEEKDSIYTAEVFILYIKPENKNRGIGTKLLTFAKEELKKQGHENMIIYCLKKNIASIKFYEKNGGKIVKERDLETDNLILREVGLEYKL